MTLKEQKLDVTDRVVGKIKAGEIQLYLEDEPIGKVKLSGNLQYELEHHYETNDQKIFKHVMTPTEQEPRYTDCDEGGWC